jgi:hypothetical protein
MGVFYRFFSVIAVAGALASAAAVTSAKSASSSSPSYSRPSSPSPSYQPSPPSYSRPSTPSVAPPVYSKPTVAPSAPVASPSLNGYSKPPSTTAPVAKAPTVPLPSISGYSKPGSTTTGSASPTAVKPPVASQSALGVAATKSMSNDSLSKYQAERAQAKNPPQPVNVNAAKNDSTFKSESSQYRSVDDYMSRRTTNITVYRNTYPTAYSYSAGMYPNYGHYDSGFLMGIMIGAMGNSMANSNWLYAHQRDPWYGQWHDDLVRQSQTNAELKTKLEKMDGELAQLKASGVQPSANTSLPTGIDSSIALAPEAMIAMAADKDTGMPWWLIVLFIGGGLVAGGIVYCYFVGKNK